MVKGISMTKRINMVIGVRHSWKRKGNEGILMVEVVRSLLRSDEGKCCHTRGRKRKMSVVVRSFDKLGMRW